jgi:hypothetical protein
MSTVWTTGVRSPAEDFSSSLCVQTSYETQSASYVTVPGIISQGKSAAGRDADYFHLVLMSRMDMRYITLPLGACMA